MTEIIGALPNALFLFVLNSYFKKYRAGGTEKQMKNKGLLLVWFKFCLCHETKLKLYIFLR